jgi:hypothetical protein
MDAQRFLVVSHLGGWRIRHDGWQSHRYRNQADAIKVAFELARGVKSARVFLQETDVDFRELLSPESPVGKIS